MQQLDVGHDGAHQHEPVATEHRQRAQPDREREVPERAHHLRLERGVDGRHGGERDVRAVGRRAVPPLARQPGRGQGVPVRAHQRVQPLVEQQLHRLRHRLIVPHGRGCRSRSGRLRPARPGVAARPRAGADPQPDHGAGKKFHTAPIRFPHRAEPRLPSTTQETQGASAPGLDQSHAHSKDARHRRPRIRRAPAVRRRRHRDGRRRRRDGEPQAGRPQRRRRQRHGHGRGARHHDQRDHGGDGPAAPTPRTRRTSTSRPPPGTSARPPATTPTRTVSSTPPRVVPPTATSSCR